MNARQKEWFLFQIFLHTCEDVASRFARTRTELYGALRRSRQLLQTLDETAVKATGRETRAYIYDPA